MNKDKEQILIPDNAVFAELNNFYLNKVAKDILVNEIEIHKNWLVNRIRGILNILSDNAITRTYDKNNSSLDLVKEIVTILPSWEEFFQNKIEDITKLIINLIGLGPFNMLLYGQLIIDFIIILRDAFSKDSIRLRLRSFRRLIASILKFMKGKNSFSLLKNIYINMFSKGQVPKIILKKIKPKID